ncbi:helix-turn-helix transcriptional regulator [Actinomadura viridis]|uniref:Transcriptional regulator with XRE-family HTH domain n=1 Tax=Actinomadura viridis TaxID=58110 RepID=A0A931DQQ3_9ACTN|nr:helix-turn-helix transcriptional regulator [Actinomadura viridis]MBG6091635.1 transcriptional regulator with XRE-family HTH domain [Actinomadura viridis]
MRPCTHIDPRESLRAQFAYTLRTLRTLKELSQEQLAKELFLSRESITAYETQRNFPDLDTCKQFDDFFGTGELFQGQWTHAQREHVRAWFESYVPHEKEATQIRTFEPLYIPGLLQTEDYIRANGLPGPQAEERIMKRLARRENLTRHEAPFLFAVLDEAVLRRPVGGAAVMREQLQHLLEMSTLPHVFIQVVREQAGWYSGLNGALTFITKPGNNTIGYVEAQFGGRLIEDTDEVSRLGVRFDQIRARALSEDGTRSLIQKTMETMRDGSVAEE